MFASTNREPGCLENIIIGIIGAFPGGFLFSLLIGRAAPFSIWNFGSDVVAVQQSLCIPF